MKNFKVFFEEEKEENFEIFAIINWMMKTQLLVL